MAKKPFLISSAVLLALCSPLSATQTDVMAIFDQAEKGEAQAQYELGYCYLKGQGVKADAAKAARWLQKAAAQGHERAQVLLDTLGADTPPTTASNATTQPDSAEDVYQMALRYEKGEGVRCDYKKAAELFRKAAEQGHAKAQYQLGNCYRDGYGVAKDATEFDKWYEAAKWYRKAAEQGHALAKKALERINAEMKKQGQASNTNRRDAKQEDAAAQCNLGVRYANGDGVPKDDTKAAELFRKAAEQGDAAAQHNLGVFYDSGRGVAKDATEAVKWYRKAAEQGRADAQNNLGVCYENGRGVAKDATEAAKWYRKAAEQGFAEAQHNLGLCYKKGIGVPQDKNEAFKWIYKAAEQGYDKAEKVLELMHVEYMMEESSDK